MSLSFSELLRKDDVWLEKSHDYIQWLFPTDTQSQYNINSPVVNKEIIKLINKTNIKNALKRFIVFLKNTKQWRNPNNHNDKRITRILRTLKLAELNIEAGKFYKYVSSIKGENKYWANEL